MSFYFPIEEFFYNPDKVFLFTGWFFWFFFVILLAGYSLVYRCLPLRTIYLLLFSFYFYYKTGGPFLLVLYFTIFSDFFWAKLVSSAKQQWKKKFFLGWSILLNLLVLSYFKYSEFFVNSIRDLTGLNIHYINHFAILSNEIFHTGFRAEHLIVPVGVSFFTFQSMSYVWDVYHGKILPLGKITDYAFFVCFFPHLVAGPIVKAHEFIHQIYAPFSLSRKEFGHATFLIMKGWIKKCMADYLAVQFIDRCFSSPHLFSGLEHTLSLFAYSLQVYMDFSGYTDMAIGIALLLGYRLKTNFLSPYKALSTSEFWKRWHISLSSWLQEYLYFPLGGNRSSSVASWMVFLVIDGFLVLISGKIFLFFWIIGLVILIWTGMYFFIGFRRKVHQYLNIMITMLLGGLWHGSSWMFVIWGGLNGVGILVHKTWQKLSPMKEKTTGSFWYKALCLIITLTFITYTRLFFRSPDMHTVEEIHRQLTENFHPELFFTWLHEFRDVGIWILVGYLIHWIPSEWKEKYESFYINTPVALQVIVVLLCILAGYQFIAGGTRPFIYFQF